MKIIDYEKDTFMPIAIILEDSDDICYLTTILNFSKVSFTGQIKKFAYDLSDLIDSHINKKIEEI